MRRSRTSRTASRHSRRPDDAAITGLDLETGRARGQRGEIGAGLGKARATRSENRDAKIREDAAQHGICRRAQDEHHYQAAQITGAEPHQRAHAASANERHANAEGDAADRDRQQWNRRMGIARLGRIEHPRHHQRLRARKRDPERQRKHAKAAAVAAHQEILNRAEGAQPCALNSEAKHSPDGNSAGELHPGRHVLHGSLHSGAEASARWPRRYFFCGSASTAQKMP